MMSERSVKDHDDFFMPRSSVKDESAPGERYSLAKSNLTDITPFNRYSMTEAKFLSPEKQNGVNQQDGPVSNQSSVKVLDQEIPAGPSQQNSDVKVTETDESNHN